MTAKAKFDSTARTQPVVDKIFNNALAAIVTHPRPVSDGVVAKRRFGGEFKPAPVGDKIVTIPVSVSEYENILRARALEQKRGYARLEAERAQFGRFELPHVDC